MKFCVIIAYELRSANKTAKQFCEKIIDYYNADTFILCQKQFVDDDDRIQLFNKNNIFQMLYDKPDPKIYYGNDSNINLTTRNSTGCWNSSGNLQVYINHDKITESIKPFYNNYDYFIHLRTDIEILFDLPPVSLFEKIPKGLYSFSPEYCSLWGGSGGANFIHKDFVIDYYSSYHDILMNQIYAKPILERLPHNFNQEKLLNMSLEIKKLHCTPIKNINYYYTAETLDDYTTWSKPVIHHKLKIICKYPEQCSEAYDNLKLWNEGYRWGYKDNCILLVPSNESDVAILKN